jgi:hypothetical protein
MTDIWFPWVHGIIHHFRPCHEGIYPLPVNHPVFGEMYDNRELASHHTPRLNQFLFEVYQLISQYGGKWELDASEGSLIYAKMCNTLGVALS